MLYTFRLINSLINWLIKIVNFDFALFPAQFLAITDVWFRYKILIQLLILFVLHLIPFEGNNTLS